MKPVTQAKASQPAVELEGVFQHVAGRCALEGVTLRLGRGDWLLLVGPNGAGKTLLTRLMLGLDRPSAGQVRVLGQDLATLGAGAMRRLRSQVGAVLQGGSLLEGLTVLDNLLLPLRQTQATRADMARAARLAITQLQLDGLEGELPRGLSLGLRRRVELARALIHRPSLLVWDGLTEGLDPAGVRETLDLLRQQHANRELTLIATDNRPAELLVDGTRVAVLARGRLLFDGPPQALTEAAQRDLELRYVLAGHP
jgi:D-methionine transport system ATP-binding protein